MTILFPVDGGAYRLEPDGWRSGPDTRGVRLHPADAARLVERHFYGEPGTLRLRALVGAHRYAVQYWTDHEVRAEVARLVADGEWTVWTAPAVPAGMMPQRASAASAAAAPPSAPASAPRTAARPPAPAPLSAAPADAGPDWPAQVHQDAFAAVLEDAARTGVPFCEICT